MPLSSSGALDVFNFVGTADVVIDVVGYYAATAGAGFVPEASQRILDSTVQPGGSLLLALGRGTDPPGSGERSRGRAFGRNRGGAERHRDRPHHLGLPHHLAPHGDQAAGVEPQLDARRDDPERSPCR